MNLQAAIRKDYDLISARLGGIEIQDAKGEAVVFRSQNGGNAKVDFCNILDIINSFKFLDIVTGV